MDRDDAIALLRELGAVFLRRARHGDLYRLPNGQTVLVARNEGDPRLWRNTIADIRRRARQEPRQ